MKSLIIDIDPEIHKQVKIRSWGCNMSMKQWVTIAIVERLKKEMEYEVELFEKNKLEIKE